MSFSRFFNAWKFVTPEKVVVKLPFHSLKPEELTFFKMDYCIPGNQIVLTFNRKPKVPEPNKSRYDQGGEEYSQKSDSVWR